MGYDLILHTHVEEDINDAYNWYEDKQEGLGELFLSELTGCYDKLKTHPEFYGKSGRNYRRLILHHFPYLIAFEIVRHKVMIYAVFHSSRNPKEILKRKKSG
jgi:plasmid stabilization system protein ParE